MVGGFKVDAVPFNPEGWGPPESTTATTTLPINIPFAPFSRSEKIGHIADWTRNFLTAAANPSNCPSSGKLGINYDAPFNFSLNLNAFPLANPDDNSSFCLVDAKPPPRPKFVPKWHFNKNHPQLPQCRDEEVEARRRSGAGEEERVKSRLGG